MRWFLVLMAAGRCACQVRPASRPHLKGRSVRQHHPCKDSLLRSLLGSFSDGQRPMPCSSTGGPLCRGESRRWLWATGQTGQGRSLPAPSTASSCASYSRSEEHTSELQSQSNLVCRLLLEKKKSQL